MKKALIVCLMVLLITDSRAQITLKKYDDPNKQGYESIIFEYNDPNAQVAPGTTPPKITKEFNIQENNPYTKVKFDSKQVKIGLNSYDLSNVNSENFFQQNFPNKIKDEYAKQIKLNTANTTSAVTKSNNTILVTYDMKIYEEEGSIVALKSTGILFDENGEIIYRLPENDQGYISPVVTQKQDFIAFKYGGLSSHGAYGIINSPGAIIRDIKNNRDIITFKSDNNKSVYAPRVKNHLIKILELNRNGNFTYSIYDSISKVLFKINLTSQEYGQLKEVNRTGFIFRSGRKLTYKEDFESQKIE